MNKKAQITIFMVLGVVAVFLIAGMIYLRSQTAQIEIKDVVEEGNVQATVENCIRNALFYSSHVIAANGGYLKPQLNYETFFGEIALGMQDGQNILVSGDVLKAEISILMNELIPICANEAFDKFPQYEITAEKPVTELEFTRKTIDALVNYPITIKEEKGRVTEIEKFNVEVPIRLGILRKGAEDIITYAVKDDKIDLTYIYDLDFNVTIIPYNDKKLIILQDPESKVKEYEYYFMFVI